MLVFFFKQKTAYEVLRSLVGSEMCIRDRLKYMADFGIEYVQTVLQVVRPQWPCVSPYRLVRGNEGDPKAIYDLTAWNSRYWDFLGEWVLTCRLYGMKAILALLSHPTARKLGYLPAYSYNVQGFKPDILACLSRPPSGAWLEILEALSLTHISEPTRLLSISHAVLRLKKKY